MRISMKATRVNAGLTQSELAQKLGVSNLTVANWERGKTCPRVEQFEAFCKACGMDSRDVFFSREYPLNG